MKHFKDFSYTYESLLPELHENSLYADATERAELLKDKEKVAEAFIFNFVAILGLLNASTHTRDLSIMRRYFMSDKKVMLANISDDNNDLSLAVKLASEAGFFKTELTVTQITRFLAKLKLGQITSVDSKILAGWLQGLKPEFIRYLKDPQVRAAVADFIKDGGETIDVSSISVLMKKKMRKLEMGGEFVPFARKFKLVERTPQQVASDAGTAPVISNDTVTQKVKADPVVSKSKDSFSAKEIPGQVSTAVKDPEPAELPKFVWTRKIQQSTLFSPSVGFLDIGSSIFEKTLMKNNLNIRNYKFTDEEKEYLKKLYNDIKPDLSELYPLNMSSVSGKITELTNKINSYGVLENNITPLEMASYLGNSSDYKFNARKLILIAFKHENNFEIVLADVSSGYSSPTVKDLYIAFDIIENAKLGYKNQLVEKLIKNMSIRNILDEYLFNVQENLRRRDSEPFKLCTIFLMKCAVEGYDLRNVFDKLEESKSYYGIGRMLENLVAFLRGADGYKAASAPTVLFGIDLHRILDKLTNDLENYKFSDQDMWILKNAGFDDYADSKRKDDILFPALESRYKADLLQNGYENSLLAKDKIIHTYNMLRNARNLNAILEDFGSNLIEFTEKFPDDVNLIEIQIESQGIDSLSENEIENFITRKFVSSASKIKDNTLTPDELVKSDTFAVNAIQTCTEYFRKSNDPSKIGNVLISIMSKNPAIYDKPHRFKSIMKLFPKMDKDEIVKLTKLARDNNYKNFFDPSYYKDTGRRAEKDEFVAIFTGLLNDSIGTEVEDYMSDILETMPGGVIGKIRNTLVGVNKLVEEVNTGEIKTFGTIDDKRLKIMLSMNDINFASIVTSDIGRKKKGERWSEYFKRAKESQGKSGKSLGDEKVTEYQTDLKQLTKTYNQSFRSGRHGDVFTKINKTYNSSIEFPEFAGFRKNNFGDGTITPAFHGTGGIAATMILRYGFKVIKSTDASVVGRMLGDGIYFSNKLDKAMQYVGNSGYGRNYGSKGYILEVDNTLGQLDKTGRNGPDYRVMGLGGDNIRSPEWCVRDPKKQLAIRKVYEVELASKNSLDRYLNESKDDGVHSFKQYIMENKLMNMSSNVVAFTFRDGLIPIFTAGDEKLELEFVDFEEALATGQIPKEYIDYSAQGPVVVFEGTKEHKIFDIRFAEAMNGEEYRLYEQYFREKILKVK
jgi:hypothetical protein